MIFISYAQLANDVYAWSQKLPRDIDAFIAVPRSGILAASMLALHRNVRFGIVGDALIRGGFRDQHTRLQTIMIIDDSINSGRSMKEAIGRMGFDGKVLHGAVYIKPGVKALHYREVALPRIFEWNWLHHYWLRQTCMDIDGVLCEDPTRLENDDGVRYKRFLRTARPKHLPSVEVNTLVTSRLEKYRMETVNWLRRHGIIYKKLIMHPASSQQERRRLNDYAKRKAQVYRARGYHLFIESSSVQAIAIHKLTGKPVLCTDTMCLYS